MRFGIIANTGKPVLKDVLRDLFSFLEENKLQYVLTEDLARWSATQGIGGHVVREKGIPINDFSKKSDVLIALGGDGTMLMAARLIGRFGVPLLGVNLGKLGFLAEVSVSDMHDAILDVCAGRYSVEERIALTTTGTKQTEHFFALNEIVIDKGSSARVIELETYVNGDYLVTHSADGIIVTTPTGSTAYSLAAGGPIVAPTSNVITINPVSPHTLTARPVVVPDDSTIRIVVKSAAKQVHITADGQVEAFYEPPVEFTITKAKESIKLIKRGKHTYYDLLRAKLMWGRDVRLGIKL